MQLNNALKNQKCQSKKTNVRIIDSKKIKTTNGSTKTKQPTLRSMIEKLTVQVSEVQSDVSDIYSILERNNLH